MKYSNLCAAILALFISLTWCHAQGTLQITFQVSPPPPGSAYTVRNYLESGMSFTPISGGYGFGRVGTDDGSGFPRSGLPDNGSAYLQAGLTDSLRFTYIYAPTFDLHSVDLAEYSTVVPDAVTVHFIGYRLDGSTVTTDFTTDGIIDGTGPLADFQTFYFGPEFSGLTRVEIPTWGWSLDNLVFTVPEPAGGALFLIGGLLLLARRRKQDSVHRGN